MRFLVTQEFSSWFSNISSRPFRVAIVGGTSQDPEVNEILRLSPLSIIHYYGIENPHSDANFNFLDLNESFHSLNEKYDLVLCSQVLEHIWAIENTFEVLAKLTATDGLLWFNCPTSNMPHGSPAYFSAGYTAEFISKHLSELGFKILLSKHFGSRRYYFMTHALRLWATESEHNRPITAYKFQHGTFLGVAHKLLRDLPGRFISLFYSKAISNDIDCATETLVIAQIRETSRP